MNPPVAQPEVIIPGSTEDNLLVKIDEKGRITITPQLDEGRKTGVAKVMNKDIQTAFEKVEIGNSEEKKVSIEVKEIAKADSYELQLPSSIFALRNGSKVIEVITPIGTLELPDNIFEAEYIKDSENVTITISNTDISDLSSENKKQVGDKPVIQFNMSVDGKPVKNINAKSTVRLYVGYTPTTEEAKKSDRIFVWHIDESGKMSAVTNAKYDNATGKVVFKVENYGSYAVAIDDKTFDDILNYRWAKDQIEILASKGIINGTSSTKYSPGKNITRADAVVLIVKALGLEAEFSKNFEDVSQEKYYYKSVGIARSLGIITGVGNDMFKPETSVTRQDLMVIVDKALKAAGISIKKGDTSDLDTFKDVSQISPYAKESISALVGEGIIKGDEKGIIAPFRSITRAETAVMVYAMYIRQLDSMLVQK